MLGWNSAEMEKEMQGVKIAACTRLLNSAITSRHTPFQCQRYTVRESSSNQDLKEAAYSTCKKQTIGFGHTDCSCERQQELREAGFWEKSWTNWKNWKEICLKQIAGTWKKPSLRQRICVGWLQDKKIVAAMKKHQDRAA